MDFPALICNDEVCHGSYLSVVLVSVSQVAAISSSTTSHQMALTTERPCTYGLVSCESKGSISLPINMWARTRYFRTWVRCGEPASS